VRFTIVMQTYT